MCHCDMPANVANPPVGAGDHEPTGKEYTQCHEIPPCHHSVLSASDSATPAAPGRRPEHTEQHKERSVDPVGFRLWTAGCEGLRSRKKASQESKVARSASSSKRFLAMDEACSDHATRMHICASNKIHDPHKRNTTGTYPSVNLRFTGALSSTLLMFGPKMGCSSWHLSPRNGPW